jgi:hypothetical protein
VQSYAYVLVKGDSLHGHGGRHCHFGNLLNKRALAKTDPKIQNVPVCRMPPRDASRACMRRLGLVVFVHRYAVPSTILYLCRNIPMPYILGLLRLNEKAISPFVLSNHELLYRYTYARSIISKLFHSLWILVKRMRASPK